MARHSVHHWGKGSDLTQLESTPPAGTVELRKHHGPKQRAALMKRNSKYVGLDVHQAMTAVTVRAEGGRVIVRSVIPLCQHTVRQFRVEELLNLRAEGESPDVGEEEERRE